MSNRLNSGICDYLLCYSYSAVKNESLKDSSFSKCGMIKAQGSKYRFSASVDAPTDSANCIERADGAVKNHLRFLLDTINHRAQLINQPMMRMTDPGEALGRPHPLMLVVAMMLARGRPSSENIMRARVAHWHMEEYLERDVQLRQDQFGRSSVSPCKLIAQWSITMTKRRLSSLLGAFHRLLSGE